MLIPGGISKKTYVGQGVRIFSVKKSEIFTDTSTLVQNTPGFNYTSIRVPFSWFRSYLKNFFYVKNFERGQSLEVSSPLGLGSPKYEKPHFLDVLGRDHYMAPEKI